MGPFMRLDRLDADIDVEHIDKIDWNYIADADILFLERPQDPDFVNICGIAKDCHVKLWVDFDDNLFDVPEWNPAYEHYKKKETIESIKKSLSLADVVSVTTPALVHVYKKYTDAKIVVVENAFNDYNFKLAEKVSQKKIINWRGSNTHRKDLILYSHAMSQLSEEHEKEWGWSFIGGQIASDLWYITDFMKACFVIEEMSIPKYMKYISNVNPSIQISPLVMNNFNSSKSNISWIEGIYSGSCHVGPDLAEFRRPGIETYQTPRDFYDTLKRVMMDDKLREKNFNLSRDFIIDNLLLSNVNKKRVEIAREIAESD
jgi:hypothetical protein